MTTIQDVVDSARHYLHTKQGEPHQVLAWRDRLRQAGQPFLARQLSRRLANGFIQGDEVAEDDVDALWKACKADEAFSQARRVLRRRAAGVAHILPRRTPVDPKRPPPSAQRLREQLALMTSKDPDLAASVRHDWALQLLQPDLESGTAETLGIAGGIWKRRWEFDGKPASLERSLRCYLAPVERGRAEGCDDAGHDRDGRGATAENGYPAVNAAFISDLLALHTEDEASWRVHVGRALSLRQRVCNAVKGNGYWERVTRAEAHFGLGQVEAAIAQLDGIWSLQPDPWERETTARQLARLGDLLGRDGPHRSLRTKLGATGHPSPHDTRRLITALYGDRPADSAATLARSVLVGKVGLALSGGGFRASLYHLGALARLAEADLLRHVEVLSAVSGGSMVAAPYYLRLRRLLQRQGSPSRADYVQLVRELIDDFRHGTAANLRNALLTDWRTCRAVLGGDDEAYARGMARAVHDKLHARIEAQDLPMHALRTVPAGEPADFHPHYHNLSRAAKVPTLMLNATTLNTGHSWQFTVTSMGESPWSITRGADPLPRLRRANYTDAHGKPVREVTLAQAVAASACVPGLFAPLTLPSLYDGYKVSLVDGGVYDNQGALALLQEDCNVLVVSDACGQLGLDRNASEGHAAPLMRSFGVFQERMRQLSYERLQAAHDSGRVTGLAYIHLKQGLSALPENWVACEDPSQPDDQQPGDAERGSTTGYGVWKAHQAALAEIRTDLDVFSEIEAAALMADGYLAMKARLAGLARDVPALAMCEHTERGWFFEPLLARLQAADPVLGAHLEAGKQMFGRITKLDTTVRRVVLAALAALAGLVLGLVVAFHRVSFTLTLGGIALALAIAAVPWLLPRLRRPWRWARALANPRAALRSAGLGWGASVFTWALARWLVPRLTRRYLDAGSLGKLG
ncbi:MAG: patatin-like phospholipase family protein [Rubrivivax sp.]|nr:patatin-like phospholipase family protein [Rubrivivax sp.]